MRNKARAVIEMTIGLVVMAGSVPAAQTFINTCPFVISSPGDYLLSADLVCGGGTGILIQSSDVTLKLEGHRITAGAGANTGFSSAISNFSGGVTGAFVARVHILGPGLITSGGGNAFLDGVALVGFVSQSEVSGITVLGSRSAGIDADGQAPGTTGLTFTANTLGRNGTGISVVNLTSSTISKNDISGNGVGISILNADVTGSPLMVSHNVLNGNTGDGLQISAGGLLIPTVTVQYNVLSGNGGNGMTVLVAREITNNTALANGMVDLVDTLPGCTETVWRANKFFTANQSCIH
jgi:hypothetical protein